VFARDGPEPLQALLKRRQVPRHRNLFCAEYERCLQEALERRWVSWTCAHCARFEPLRQWELVGAAAPQPG
jgi:hypothetical protein